MNDFLEATHFGPDYCPGSRAGGALSQSDFVSESILAFLRRSCTESINEPFSTIRIKFGVPFALRPKAVLFLTTVYTFFKFLFCFVAAAEQF